MTSSLGIRKFTSHFPLLRYTQSQKKTVMIEMVMTVFFCPKQIEKNITRKNRGLMNLAFVSIL